MQNAIIRYFGVIYNEFFNFFCIVYCFFASPAYALCPSLGMGLDELKQFSMNFSSEKEFKVEFQNNLKKAKKGEAKAMLDLANSYLLGNGTKRDVKKAIYWNQRASIYNNSYALDNLSLIYEIGAIGKRDFAKALEYKKECAKFGNIDCMFDVANCYETGEIVEKNEHLAVKFYLKAASSKTEKYSSSQVDSVKALIEKYSYICRQRENNFYCYLDE